MNKKKLLSLALVVIMIATISFSSLAWFSDRDTVTNNFSIAGGENSNPDEIFSIDVMEVVDADGDGDYDMNDATIGYDKDPHYTDTFTYEKILPGDMLLKRPQTKNTGSYEQWVRMKVTFDNANYWVALMQKYGYTDMLDMLYMPDGTTKLTKANTWTYAPEETYVENDQVTYVFYYNDVLEVGETAIFFGYVKIPHQFTQQDMAPFTNGDFRMVVTGETIQVKNLEADNAQDAFEIVEADQPIG